MCQGQCDVNFAIRRCMCRLCPNICVPTTRHVWCLQLSVYRVPLGVLSSPNFQAALVVSCFMGQSVSFGWLMWVIFPQQNMYLFHIIKCKWCISFGGCHFDSWLEMWFEKVETAECLAAWGCKHECLNTTVPIYCTITIIFPTKHISEHYLSLIAH